jgi:rhodanese-related sulfurtransferase
MRRFNLPALLVSLVAGSAFAAEHTKESFAQVKEHVDQQRAVMVDVREQQEWDAGHVDGAIFLPLSAVSDGLTPAELSRLPKSKVLYTYCVVGRRALTAANVLEKHGYTVHAIKPGYRELVEAGFPSVSK